MPYIRKAQAGADSHGHVWPENGAVVEVDGDVAAALLRIPDGGFSLVHDHQPEPEPVEEPAPEPENPVDEAPKPRPQRGGRKPRSASADKPVEE